MLQNLSYTRLNYLTTNRLDYIYNLNEVHNFTFMAGYSYQKTVYDNFNVTGENFPSNDLHTMNSAASVSSGGGNTEEVAFESYFGRVTYDFYEQIPGGIYAAYRWFFTFWIRRALCSVPCWLTGLDRLG
ncbi:MAG: hypothetical protein U5L09_15545 [Bacteroidales bacterium]|nr:hypothetical protein [Bacteroidales bacterium]